MHPNLNPVLNSPSSGYDDGGEWVTTVPSGDLASTGTFLVMLALTVLVMFCVYQAMRMSDAHNAKPYAQRSQAMESVIDTFAGASALGLILIGGTTAIIAFDDIIRFLI